MILEHFGQCLLVLLLAGGLILGPVSTLSQCNTVRLPNATSRKKAKDLTTSFSITFLCNGGHLGNLDLDLFDLYNIEVIDIVLILLGQVLTVDACQA